MFYKEFFRIIINIHDTEQPLILLVYMLELFLKNFYSPKKMQQNSSKNLNILWAELKVVFFGRIYLMGKLFIWVFHTFLFILCNYSVCKFWKRTKHLARLSLILVECLNKICICFFFNFNIITSSVRLKRFYLKIYGSWCMKFDFKNFIYWLFSPFLCDIAFAIFSKIKLLCK